jgi:hypothetical protein
VQAKTSNLLLANIAFANLLVSFLVKPISAIYLSYALSTGRWQVQIPLFTKYLKEQRQGILLFLYDFLLPFA